MFQILEKTVLFKIIMHRGCFVECPWRRRVGKSLRKTSRTGDKILSKALRVLLAAINSIVLAVKRVIALHETRRMRT